VHGRKADGARAPAVEREGGQPVEDVDAARCPQEHGSGADRGRHDLRVGVINRLQRRIERTRIGNGLERAKGRRAGRGSRGEIDGHFREPVDGASPDDRQPRHRAVSRDGMARGQVIDEPVDLSLGRSLDQCAGRQSTIR
jgi:hypothetical protein